MLIIFRPFKLGDFIEVAGTSGVVEEIRIFHTVLKSGDNREITMPNAQTYGGTIVNYSARETRRIDLVISIGYGDGVVDSKDRCPDTPSGARVNARGCELDSDGDGVVDSKDRCPNTPQGATVDGRGCALGIVLENVQFRLNSGDLTTESRAILDKVAASLKARGDITSVMVIGHTDASGAAAYNQSLSERRAKSVADYLVSQGVDSAILGFKGMGESVPVADNATAEGRAKNRRVELKLN